MAVSSEKQRCSQCKVQKPLTDFYTDKRRPRGRASACKKCVNIKTLERYHLLSPEEKRARWYSHYTDPEYMKWYAIQRKYGITKSEYTAMLKQQRGRCASCNKRFLATPDVDHCHDSNAVQGLLCHACNVALGLLREDPFIIRRLANYIERTAA